MLYIKIVMYYPFWEVASHWDKITTFSFLSIIQLNYHQLINLGYEKNQGIPPFGDVSDPWYDTSTFSFLSSLLPNDHQSINLSH